jgi:hypothetical protein
MSEKPRLGGPQGYAVGASGAFRTFSKRHSRTLDIREGIGIRSRSKAQLLELVGYLVSLKGRGFSELVPRSRSRAGSSVGISVSRASGESQKQINLS